MAHVRIAGLTKTYGTEAVALRNVHLAVERGELVALIGPSGSGKSTLLRHIAGLVAADRSTQSLVEVGGNAVQSAGRISSDVRRLRSHVGFVFQQFNLVNRLTVLTNVRTGALGRMPLWRAICGWFTAKETALALESLRRVGIAEQSYKRAGDLSGGQQQRAAIARALMQQAEVILADEPIASLDPESSRRVMETLAHINAEDGITVLVSLHQVDMAVRYCKRVVALRHGEIVFDGPATGLTPGIFRQVYGADEEARLAMPGMAATTASVPEPLEPLLESPAM